MHGLIEPLYVLTAMFLLISRRQGGGGRVPWISREGEFVPYFRYSYDNSRLSISAGSRESCNVQDEWALIKH